MFLVSLFAMLLLAQGAEESKTGTVIGIDLGTTYSCVAIYQNGKVDIIANEAGSRITPSVVSFSDHDRLVGEAAKHQMAQNPQNTIFAIKRLMGLRYSDPEVLNELKRLPYKVIDKDDHPFVEVTYKGKKETFSPESISALILSKMKTIAEDYLGKKVQSAVITVPAYFSDSQRKATQDAGTIAGLNVLRILNEPTAASLAYGLDKKGSRKILVFDLGGGTFDVSCLSVDDGLFEVLATGGDTHLGGEDFDDRTIEYLRQQHLKKTGKDPKKNLKAMAKLKREAEKAKHTLSTITQVQIEIENFMDGEDFTETLTRAKFEEINADLFKKCMEPVSQVLKDAHLTKSEIDEIVLVGGSTRIPKVQNLVRSFFGKDPSKAVNPDEAVAHGAAIQASILSDDEDAPDNIILVNVNPLTLGIETMGGVMAPLIPRNSRVPTTKSKIFTTAADNQEMVKIQVYEGERPMTKDNHELASFDLYGIKPAPRGVPQIEVTFEIDSNGMLYVSAEDKASKSREQISINAQEARLSEAEREEAIRRAEEMKEEDEIIKQTAQARNNLESFISDVRIKISDDNNAIDDSTKDQIREILDEAQKWYDENRNEQDKELFEDKLKEISEQISPYLKNIPQAGGYHGSPPDDEIDHDDL